MKPDNFEMYYFAKPAKLNQAWGIKNDSYVQFDFTRHNGEDYALESDSLVHSPIDGEVISVEWQPNGGGNMIRIKTGQVRAEGTLCYVVIVLMHAKEILKKVGDKVKVGDVIMIADNTGFSTGPHTHISCYRLGLDGSRLDTDKSVNYTFNPAPYWNGFYAIDKGTVIGTLTKIISLLTEAIKNSPTTPQAKP